MELKELNKLAEKTGALGLLNEILKKRIEDNFKRNLTKEVIK